MPPPRFVCVCVCVCVCEGTWADHRPATCIKILKQSNEIHITIAMVIVGV
jgi:hypothetical protein